MTYTVVDVDEEPPMRRMAGWAGRFGVREALAPNGQWWPVISECDGFPTRWAAIWVALDGSLSAKLIALWAFGTGDVRERLEQFDRSRRA